MRLSDAIALGRTLARPTASVFYDPHRNCACARGMACLAIGKEMLAGDAEKETWPWLNQEFSDPCHCGVYRETPHPAWAIINHLMFHVVGEKDNELFPQTWSLDQLIDWVRSVEPSEPPQPLTAAVTSPAENALAVRLNLDESTPLLDESTPLAKRVEADIVERGVEFGHGDWE